MDSRTVAEDQRSSSQTTIKTIGVLRATSAAFAFVHAGGEKVFVAGGDLGVALDGDVVEVEITGRGEKGPRGRLVRVISREARRVCGLLGPDKSFVPDDPRLPGTLAVTGELPAAAVDGGIYGAELRAGLGAAEVRVLQCLGRRGDPRAEEDAILWREQVGTSFSPDVLAEAEDSARRVQAGGLSGRVDLRSIDFVTIDPVSAEDHDDALFASRAAGGVRVFVAIADVAAFVPGGGSLDAEAQRRTSSIYFPGRVVPMLPPLLSNDAASLLPGVDRPALVLELRLDTSLRVKSKRIVPALIRVRRRLTYGDARELLESRGALQSESLRVHADSLLTLDHFAQGLREQRKRRGAIAVESAGTRIDCGPDGLPVRIVREAPDPWLVRAHQLVEEWMLLANETVASVLSERGTSALFRVHQGPSDERALRLIQAAHRIGLTLEPSVALDPLLLRKFVQAIHDVALREELSELVLDALPAASYAERRDEHFALASRQYVHFTSPIRRYADLTIHRAVRAGLGGAPSQPTGLDSESTNTGQRRTRAIQREVMDLYSAMLMQQHVGNTYAGTVIRTAKRSAMVVLDEPAVVVRCHAGPSDLTAGARISVRVQSVSIARRSTEATYVGSLEV